MPMGRVAMTGSTGSGAARLRQRQGGAHGFRQPRGRGFAVACYGRCNVAILHQISDKRLRIEIAVDHHVVVLARVAEIVEALAEVIGPEIRYARVVLVAAGHVQRGDTRVLLGDAPVFYAERFVRARQGELRDVTGGVKTGCETGCETDYMHR